MPTLPHRMEVKWAMLSIILKKLSKTTQKFKGYFISIMIQILYI